MSDMSCAKTLDPRSFRPLLHVRVRARIDDGSDVWSALSLYGRPISEIQYISA